jgi:hypothetical protein
MDHASQSTTYERAGQDPTAQATCSLGRRRPRPPVLRATAAGLALCAVLLPLLGCAARGNALDAAMSAPPGLTSASTNTSTGTSVSGAAPIDPSEGAHPAWVVELVDVPPGRVARLEDTSWSYIASGHFEDVLAQLERQLGEPASEQSVRDTPVNLTWSLKGGKVAVVATQPLWWKPPIALIIVKRKAEVAPVGGEWEPGMSSRGAAQPQGSPLSGEGLATVGWTLDDRAQLM